MSIMQPVTKDWLLEVCEKFRFGLQPPAGTGNYGNRPAVAPPMPTNQHTTDMPPPQFKAKEHTS